MPVRIYALAKDLGIDNKELLDICDKLGIKGKGSALASLDEEEVNKIQEHIKGGAEKPAPAAVGSQATQEIEAPVRNDILVQRPKSVRDLSQKPARSDGEAKPASPEPARKQEINVKLATMPEVAQPTASVQPTEKVQKPDIALPQDAILDAMRKKTSSGSVVAPLEEFTKSKVRPKKKGSGSAEPVAQPPMPGEKAPLSGR